MRTIALRLIPHRFLEFALVGAGVALGGIVILFVLVESLHIDERAAFSIQLGATVLANFLLNKYLTWKDRTRGLFFVQLGRFVVTRAVTIIGSLIAFPLLMLWSWGIPYQYVFATAAVIAASTAVNFITSDRIVFGLSAEGSFHRKGENRMVGRHRRPPVWKRGSGLRRRQRRLSRMPLYAVGLPIASVAAARYDAPSISTITVLLVISQFNLVMAGLELCWRLYGRRTPEAFAAMKFPEPVTVGEAEIPFSIIVPALHEQDVLGHTLDRLAQQTHPDVEIIATLCSDDVETILEANRAAERHPGKIQVIDRHYEQSNKPSQLNAALEHCTGEYVGVIDAEDDVHPDLLLHVEALIRKEHADVVQGGVQLRNLGRKLRHWYCVHNVLEYFFWFTSRMFFQVSWGFVPLGGNTVFIRHELLIQAGGWPINLTEDCALGVKLCTEHGAKVVAAYDPALITSEETPPKVFGKGGLVRQRTRWDQGFLSVLMEGKWRKLPTIQQRLMAWYILATPFIQALSGLMLPIALYTFFVLKAPVGLVMLMYLPFVPITISQVMQIVGLREFGQMYGQKVRLRHYIYLVLGAYPYQVVLMIAAVIAVVRHVTRRTNWHKTHHENQHRNETYRPEGEGDLEPDASQKA